MPQVKIVTIPAPHKDLNAWRKAGATDGDVFNAMVDAKDYNLSGAHGAQDAAQPVEDKPSAVSPRISSTDEPESVPIERCVSAQTLSQTLDAAVAFLKRYVVFANEAQAVAVALWCAHTFVYDSFDFTPYLYISAPDSGCGKSTLLDCVELLVSRPSKCSGTSDAAFWNEIDQEHPTLLFDEVDNFLKDEKSPIIGMINDGFKRGATVKKCADFGRKIEKLDVYCPKALTGIGKVQKTLHSRSIEIRLTRESKGTGHKFRSRVAGKLAEPVRLSLQAWALTAKKELIEAEPELPDELEGRQQDLAEPLVAIADMAGGDWPQQARDALLLLFSTREDQSVGEQLLASCREIFHYQDKMTTGEMLERLIRIEDAPWAVMWEADVKHNQIGRPASKLSNLLRPYGILPTNVRVEKEVHKGYAKESFKEAWGKYLPKENMEPKTLELGLVA